MKREAACVAGEGVVALCSGAECPKCCAPSSTGSRSGASPPSSASASPAGWTTRCAPAMSSSATPWRRARAERYDAQPPLRRVLREGVAAAGCPAVPGAVVGVDAPVMDRRAKARLRDRRSAVAVDMESHLAAEFAARRGLPFAVVRAISDPAARALPPLAAKALDPNGGVDVAECCARTGARAGADWRSDPRGPRLPRGLRDLRPLWSRFSARCFASCSRISESGAILSSKTYSAGRCLSSEMSGAIGPSVRTPKSATFARLPRALHACPPRRSARSRNGPCSRRISRNCRRHRSPNSVSSINCLKVGDIAFAEQIAGALPAEHRAQRIAPGRAVIALIAGEKVR